MKNSRGLPRRLTALACTLVLILSLMPGALAKGDAAPSCAHDRNPAWWTYESVQPTCTEEGRSVRTCSHCGARETLSTTPANGHSWVRKTEEATTSKGGKVYQVCRICGKKETLSTTGAKLHTGSGNAAVRKLSRREIAQLLWDAPELGIAVSEDNYDALPSVQAPFDAGKVKSGVLQAAWKRLNLYRRLAGVPEAALDETLCDSAQWGSLVLAAGGALTHSPARPEGMEESAFEKGAAAAAAGCQASGYSLTGAVDAWMADSAPTGLAQLGHRTWLLNPTLGKVGFGITDGVSLAVVTDRSGAGCAYDYLAWPASGNFPDELFDGPEAVWSVRLNPDVYDAPVLKELSVTLTCGNRTWKLRGEDAFETSETDKYLGCAGYRLIFRPGNVTDYQGTYTVKIEGLRDHDGFTVPLQYQVTFFHAGDVYLSYSQQQAAQTANPFRDVEETAYYRDAVLWALASGVTTGVTDTAFQPSAACTRGQVAAFLWRAKGAPEAEAAESPFPDVTPGGPFYEAVLWAAENGITGGAGDGTFQPGAPCTNAQVLVFLWRAEGRPAAAGESALAEQYPGQYYTDALAWADAAGLLESMGNGALQPHQRASRANIVTWLYRLAE